MQGWLYVVRSNRLGLQYSRKRYFVLEDYALKCYKDVPGSNGEVFGSLRVSWYLNALLACMHLFDEERRSMGWSNWLIFFQEKDEIFALLFLVFGKLLFTERSESRFFVWSP